MNSTSLRRHNASDGTYTDYTITSGNSCCMTDGNFLYVPVDNFVCKYSLDGTFVSQNSLDITPLQWVFSTANDTVWCGTNADTMYGYACSKFSGGSLTPDATWYLGSASGDGVLVGWDGTYYYVAWNGHAHPTFKRFNANRTLVDSGTISIDTRGLLCKVAVPSSVAQPSGNGFAPSFAMLQSLPNPLASGTVIRYALPRPAQVELRVYDVDGTPVRWLVNGQRPAGQGSAYWDGRDDSGRRVAAGVYCCRLRAGDFTAAQKLVVRQ